MDANTRMNEGTASKYVNMVITSTQDYLRRCLAPIGDRLRAIEARTAPEELKSAIESQLPALVDQQLEQRMDSLCAKAALLIPPGRDGLPGRPGTPGEDGFTPDDFEMKLKPDGRTVEIAMQCGERVVTKSIRLEGFPIYKGVYQASKAYGKDDCCTYGGSIWRAVRATTEPPKGRNDSWQLIVKGGKG